MAILMRVSVDSGVRRLVAGVVYGGFSLAQEAEFLRNNQAHQLAPLGDQPDPLRTVIESLGSLAPEWSFASMPGIVLQDGSN